MKLLLIGDYPPPHGGVAIHVQQLHRFFEGSGVTARVLDIGKGGEASPGVVPMGGTLGFGRKLLRYAADGWLMHLHTGGDNPKSWLVIASVGATGRAVGTGRVLTLHSGNLPRYLAGSARRRAFARMALAHYSEIVAVSTAVRGALVEAGVEADRIRVHPAFCGSQVRAGRPPAGLDAVLRRRSPLLVFAHHPSPVYGRGVMFDAVRRLASRYPDVGLAVFGPGTDSEAFRADARRARVEGLVESFGELPHPQALGLIRNSQVFVRPTTVDGDAISVREALALDVPCVASDVVARPGGVVLFKGGDAADLADRIGEALARGPARVHSPDVGPLLMQIYRRAAGGAPESAAAAR